MTEQVTKAWHEMNENIRQFSNKENVHGSSNNFRITHKPNSAMPFQNKKTRFFSGKTKSGIRSSLPPKQLSNFQTTPILFRCPQIELHRSHSRQGTAFDKSQQKALQKVGQLKSKFRLDTIEFFVELYRLRIEYSQMPLSHKAERRKRALFHRESDSEVHRKGDRLVRNGSQ